MPIQTRKLTLRFPCEVAQISPCELNMIVPVFDGPVLITEAVDKIAGELSGAERDKLYDDTVDFLQNEAIRRSIRVL